MRERVRLKKDKECDVFVMGAGIAGIMAAIEASNNGQKVIISSSSNIFSGSSFYPGTWGLGLIGPEDRNDEEDLAKTIKEVGCNVVDEELVETFVKNINPSIDLLKEMGVNVVICGGIGSAAMGLLMDEDILVIPGMQGDIEVAVASYLDGATIPSTEANCDHHDHGDGEHNCGGCSCGSCH